VDLSSLAELGKVAGVAGIAIGLIALAPQFAKGAADLPRSERARTLGDRRVRDWPFGHRRVGSSKACSWGQAHEERRLQYLNKQNRDRRHGQCSAEPDMKWCRSPRPALVPLVVLAIVAPHAVLAVGDSVTVGQCSIATAESASNNTVTCNFGLTDAQLKEVTEAAVKGARSPFLTHISRTFGISEDAARSLLRIVGEDPNIPDDKLGEVLNKVFGDYKRLQAQSTALSTFNATATALLDQAKLDIEAGHFDRAHELLRQATQAQIAAAQEKRKLREEMQEAGKLKQEAQAAEDAQLFGAAKSSGYEADLALTQRRYLEAATLFGQAAGYVPRGHVAQRGEFLRHQAEALLRQGVERGDNVALNSSIEVDRRALAYGFHYNGRRPKTISVWRWWQSVNAKAGQAGSRKPLRLSAWRFRKMRTRASRLRSNGRRRRTIWALRSIRLA